MVNKNFAPPPLKKIILLIGSLDKWKKFYREVGPDYYHIILFKTLRHALDYLKKNPVDYLLINQRGLERPLKKVKHLYPSIILGGVDIALLDADFTLDSQKNFLVQLSSLQACQPSLTLAIKGNGLYYELCQNSPISSQEKEILLLLSNGNTTKDISEQLNLTENTINKYLYQLRVKLNAENTTHLICIAFRGGLVY